MEHEKVIQEVKNRMNWCLKEYKYAMGKDLMMIAYDMSSRYIAYKHLLEWLTGKKLKMYDEIL